VLNIHRVRVRAAKDAPRNPFRVLERRHALAEIVVRGGGVSEEHLRVTPPQFERDFMTLPENASRHRYHLAIQRLGFFDAP
jgi:hypothetical protein